MTRILVTGSRYYDNAYLVQKWLSRVVNHLHPEDAEPPTLIHGGAKGADSLADAYWKKMGWPIEVHEANWDEFGKAAGFLRNQDMAKAGADICVAFPQGESRGTRMMMSLAKDYGITVLDVEKAEEEGR